MILINAHIPKDGTPDSGNPQGRLLLDMIHNYNLFVASTSCLSKGPNYTFFSGTNQTTVDYIITDVCLASAMCECQVHDHHPLNFSDHLPITISLELSSFLKSPSLSCPKINWTKSLNCDGIQEFAQEISNFISPLLLNTPTSVSELNAEIISVCEAIQQAAFNNLSTRPKHKQPKTYIKDPELKALCKSSKAAWRVWCQAGHPQNGTLYEAKQSIKKLVRKYVTSCHAQRKRAEIQKRDEMFKEGHNFRFKCPPKSTECKRLLVNGKMITEILQHFRSYFEDLSSSKQPLPDTLANLSSMECASFLNEEKILDVEVCVEEIEVALKAMKLGKSCGGDGLDPEHIYYGGEILKVWLKKVFNRIIALEEVPVCLKEGVILLVYKGKGKDPLQMKNYRGITLSSVIAKLFELIILHRLSPIFEETGFPDISQTAYQRGLSCAHAIYATQEALLTHIREGGNQYICFYDVEKAFDSIELPILLKQLFEIGINGKLWRLLKSWYTHSPSRVRLNNCLSDLLHVGRGVKQGSVLSPTLFLTVMDCLLGRMREGNLGSLMRGVYTGAAIHADDVRTIATPRDEILHQANVIQQFTDDTCLNLNVSKLEVVKISKTPQPPEKLQIIGHNVETTPAAKCLGVWWQSNLSASKSVNENVKKARKAFFALGSLGAFQGDLNPLSTCSIFETCVLPILLYGCETWLLDSSCLAVLESFQCETGRRILRLPKHHSGNAVRIGLHWPSMSTRIFLRKVAFLSKLLHQNKDSLCSRIFTSLAIENVYNTSIVQQCRMLESELKTDIVAKCLQTALGHGP